ncbi:hypothetical protein EDD18DRAFT_1107760 [Armillaria luteobubalina]|uniref:Uncharacterized protein n=1 Tax=Armillaria luteobubalina TaxID=153913 RepID=A0AA39Q041_9AGAR|nr:hypothetical protein EDD18DRAFT_1107760 [Armillaria luteobubalina]
MALQFRMISSSCHIAADEVKKGVVPNGTMEVVVPARMVDSGGMKPDEGFCIWYHTLMYEKNSIDVSLHWVSSLQTIKEMALLNMDHPETEFIMSLKYTLSSDRIHKLPLQEGDPDLRIYTGIIAITMWTVCTAFDWSFNQWIFIDNGWNFWTVFLAFNTFSTEFQSVQWIQSIAALISTLAADASMGIAPTLIVGQVAAGHAHPEESCKGSISSSLHFGHDSEDQSQGTINSDVEGGTVTSEEEQSSVTSGGSSEQGQGVGEQEDETGWVLYVEIV